MSDYIKISKDDMNRYLTKSLFLETAKPEQRAKFGTPFTLKEEDWELDGIKYISLRRLYLEISDPSEYEFAQIVFGSWKHWQSICNATWFRDIHAEWKEELEIKLQSKALKSIIHSATEDGSRGTVAAKYLMEKGWVKQKGRPSKATIAKEATKMARVYDEIEEDLDRMMEHMH